LHIFEVRDITFHPPSSLNATASSIIPDFFTVEKKKHCQVILKMYASKVIQKSGFFYFYLFIFFYFLFFFFTKFVPFWAGISALTIEPQSTY